MKAALCSKLKEIEDELRKSNGGESKDLNPVNEEHMIEVGMIYLKQALRNPKKLESRVTLMTKMPIMRGPGLENIAECNE